MRVFFRTQDHEDFLKAFNPCWKAFLVFFALLFTTQMSFRGSEFVPAGQMDLQVFIRLGVLGALFLAMLPYYKLFFSLVREIPVFFHLLFLFCLTAISILPGNFGVYPLYALATHVLMFYVITVFVLRYGMNNTLYYYVMGVFLFCVVSIIYYYFVPDVGRYTYWENHVLFQSTRMSGIAGHPNTLGFMTATAMLAFLHLFVNRFPVGRMIYIAVAVIFISLILTNSRTSLGGMLLMAMLYLALYFRAFVFLSLIGVAGVAFILVSSLSSWDILPDLMRILSRSGDAEEVTSLTGRSHIWEQMFLLIEEKPYFGWGHARIAQVLIEHRDQIGFSIGQAHNQYLQIMFAGGIVGMFLYALGFVAALVPAFLLSMKERAPFILCVLIYVLFAGLTETIMLSSVANNAYLVFIVCLSSLAVLLQDGRVAQGGSGRCA